MRHPLKSAFWVVPILGGKEKRFWEKLLTSSPLWPSQKRYQTQNGMDLLITINPFINEADISKTPFIVQVRVYLDLHFHEAKDHIGEIRSFIGLGVL